MEGSATRISNSRCSCCLITLSAPVLSPLTWAQSHPKFGARESPHPTDWQPDSQPPQGHHTAQQLFSQSQCPPPLFHFTQQLFQAFTTLPPSLKWLSPCHSQEKEGESSLPYPPRNYTHLALHLVLPISVNSVHDALCGAPCPGGIQEETPDLHDGLPGLRLGME